MNSGTPLPRDTETEREKLVESLFHGTGDTYDKYAHYATWGRDKRWKEELLGLIECPTRILDLACGTGILLLEMARRFEVHVTGVELRPEYLDICRVRAQEGGYDVRTICGNAEDVVLNDHFSHITSCYIPKYIDLDKTVPHLVQMLAPGGTILMQDFTYPSKKWVRNVFFDHFQRMTERFKEEPDWQHMWSVLPDVIRNSTWVADMERLFHENGLVDVQVIKQSLGMSCIVTGRSAAEENTLAQ